MVKYIGSSFFLCQTSLSSPIFKNTSKVATSFLDEIFQSLIKKHKIPANYVHMAKHIAIHFPSWSAKWTIQFITYNYHIYSISELDKSKVLFTLYKYTLKYGVEGQLIWLA